MIDLLLLQTQLQTQHTIVLLTSSSPSEEYSLRYINYHWVIRLYSVYNLAGL